MIKLGLVLIGVFALAPAVQAETVYTWVDSNGVKHFSDKPPQGNDRMQVAGEIQSGSLGIDKYSNMRPYDPPKSGKLVKPDPNLVKQADSDTQTK